MRRAKILIAMMFAAVFVITGFSSAVAAEKEGKIVPEKKIKAHKIIRLHYVGGIDKPELTVEPGTTVIWINDSRASVELQFIDKQVTMACKSPVHFVVDEDGTFISDKIPQGSVASLCFVEKGTFEYVMMKSSRHGVTASEYRGTQTVFQGKVIVK